MTMQNGIIISDDLMHANTINDLACKSKISHVRFVVNGKCHIANSVSAATEWLKANGYYVLDKTDGRNHNDIRWFL